MDFDKEMIKQLITYLQSQSCLFQGIYDAKYGRDSYMYGIGTVIEAIADIVSEEYCNKILGDFYDNMEDCQIKARENTTDTDAEEE